MPLCIDIRRAMALASVRLALPEISLGSVIVGMEADMTLRAVYAATGIVTPMYSTNLATMPVEWLSVAAYSNTLIDGTNVFTFDPPDTNSAAVFYHLRVNP
mgnify:CR=1 FL=1